MPLAGQAAIAIWNDITPEGRANFDEWHPREHMPERVSIPGFLRGRRYAAIEAEIAYFTFYETADLDVLAGADYRARLNNPTEWSKATVKDFRNNLRGVARVAYSSGHADGSYLGTIRLAPSPGRDGDLKTYLTKALAAEIQRPGISGTHLCLCDPELSGTNTQLQRERTIGIPAWVVLVEGISAQAVRTAMTTLTPSELHRHGAEEGAIPELFGLEYSISKIAG